jgi:hypothetical protein
VNGGRMTNLDLQKLLQQPLLLMLLWLWWELGL